MVSTRLASIQTRVRWTSGGECGSGRRERVSPASPCSFTIGHNDSFTNLSTSLAPARSHPFSPFVLQWTNVFLNWVSKSQLVAEHPKSTGIQSLQYPESSLFTKSQVSWLAVKPSPCYRPENQPQHQQGVRDWLLPTVPVKTQEQRFSASIKPEGNTLLMQSWALGLRRGTQWAERPEA